MKKRTPAPRTARSPNHGGARPRSTRPRTHLAKRSGPKLIKGEFLRDSAADEQRGDRHLNHSASIAASIADIEAWLDGK